MIGGITFATSRPSVARTRSVVGKEVKASASSAETRHFYPILYIPEKFGRRGRKALRASFELNQIRSAKRSSLGSVSRTQTRFHGDITNPSCARCTIHRGGGGYKAASSYRSTNTRAVAARERRGGPRKERKEERKQHERGTGKGGRNGGDEKSRGAINYSTALLTIFQATILMNPRRDGPIICDRV